MLFNYESHSLKPGIYRILNSHNGRVYIGQAKEFKARWRGHSSSLLKNKHQNKFLQADFSKCREELGHDNFLEFHVVEVMEGSTKEQRGEREEALIATVFDGGKQCYNLTTRAVSREGCPAKNPEETRAKRSVKSKAMWSDPEFKEATREAIRAGTTKPDSRKLRSEVMKEVWRRPEHREKVTAHRQRPDLKQQFMQNCHSPQSIEKSKQARRKLYGKVLSPAGEVYEVWSLSEFCRQHGLGLQNQSNLGRLLRGKYTQLLGWKLLVEPEKSDPQMP